MGKPLSHPVHPRVSGGVGVAGAPSPAPSSIERGPSSAYFSGGSPQVDTSFQSPASPLFQSQLSPRSPGLIRSHVRNTSIEESSLKSPKLVESSKPGHLGYTVAHYGQGEEPSTYSIQTKRYFGDEYKPGDYKQEYKAGDYKSPEYKTADLRSPHADSTVDSGVGSTVTKHRYFEASDQRPSKAEPEWRKSLLEQPPPVPKSPLPEESTQLQMTRSAEVKLYQDEHGVKQPSHVKTEELGYKTGGRDGEEGYDYRITSERVRDIGRPQQSQASPAPIGDVPPSKSYERTTSYERTEPTKIYEQTTQSYEPYEHKPKYEQKSSREHSFESRPFEPTHYETKYGKSTYDEPPKDYEEEKEPEPLNKSEDLAGVPFESVVEKKEFTPSHKRQPSGAPSTPTTPASSRREVIEQQSESRPESRPTSKPTTPKLSLKFGKSKEKDPNKGFDFGKSKFTSKHEVIKRGKDVEVKLDSLKLGKEDQLRIVVLRKFILQKNRIQKLVFYKSGESSKKV